VLIKGRGLRISAGCSECCVLVIDGEPCHENDCPKVKGRRTRIPGPLTMREEPTDSAVTGEGPARLRSYLQWWVDCPPDPKVPGQTIGAPFANAYSEEFAREITTACNNWNEALELILTLKDELPECEGKSPYFDCTDETPCASCSSLN